MLSFSMLSSQHTSKNHSLPFLGPKTESMSPFWHLREGIKKHNLTKHKRVGSHSSTVQMKSEALSIAIHLTTDSQTYAILQETRVVQLYLRKSIAKLTNELSDATWDGCVQMSLLSQVTQYGANMCWVGKMEFAHESCFHLQRGKMINMRICPHSDLRIGKCDEYISHFNEKNTIFTNLDGIFVRSE